MPQAAGGNPGSPRAQEPLQNGWRLPVVCADRLGLGLLPGSRVRTTMSNTTCEHCHKNVATVTVIEIPPRPKSGGDDGAAPQPHQQSLCEICAQAKNLPHAPVVKKTFGDLWKLLQTSGEKPKEESTEACPDCGMTLGELRSRGRIGCARDYELFSSHIHQILQTVHGSTEHVGRVPGLSPDELGRMQAITVLRRDLDTAIKDEAYESAARIRDELKTLEGLV
ncbi:MAG: protein arginine kinase activator [Candidatus Paceibacteria bacterium]|jgi:protein arginine kinase activator